MFFNDRNKYQYGVPMVLNLYKMSDIRTEVRIIAFSLIPLHFRHREDHAHGHFLLLCGKHS